ncbi:hypothetical protein M569_12616 [Genlisea aurea]|uniref:Uncharacterized protein n=1 Tax=Genlisea aurea TaxID=192259 RepID=S8DQV4_9LAMI|nr:hypothetical protein M569_12616 [Genlisea aurea]
MDSVDDFNWVELIDCESLLSEVAPPPDLHCNPQPGSQKNLNANRNLQFLEYANPLMFLCVGVTLVASLIGNASYESECPRKR